MINNVVKFRQSVRDLPDDLMLISDFAEKYGCDKSFIYKLRDRGRLRLYPIGHFKVSVSEALRAMGV